MLALAPRFIGWMLPVIAGMLISVPFTVLTSRASIGRALRRHGLLLTPEETCPPPELAALQAAEPLKPVGGLRAAAAGGAGARPVDHDRARAELRSPLAAHASGRLRAHPEAASHKSVP